VTVAIENAKTRIEFPSKRWFSSENSHLANNAHTTEIKQLKRFTAVLANNVLFPFYRIVSFLFQAARPIEKQKSKQTYKQAEGQTDKSKLHLQTTADLA